MTILVYLLKTLLISGLLLGYYWFFLRNKSFHRYNRCFLLGIPVISFVLPLLRLTLPGLWKQSANSPIHLLGVANGTLEEAVTIYARQGFWKGLPWELICLVAGLLISLFLFYRFCQSLHYLHVLRTTHPHYELQGADIYFVQAEGTPFSFFSCIFWNKEQELNSPHGLQIFRHELYHVLHKHSADILFLEIIGILCWFNPFFHLLRKEVRTVHEFLADAYAAAETDELEYAQLLLISAARPKSIPITHPFFQNSIKRRIAMMTTCKKTKPDRLGRMMTLPAIVLLLGLFAFKLQIHPALVLHSPKTIRMVVDAGHGGSYPGISANGILEKDIDLQIAKKIQQLAGEYNIEVIMTRENDEIPGHPGNLHDDLLYRAKLPAKENADLFVSIHSNGGVTEKAEAGFEIYIPQNTSPVYSGSVKLGSGISEFIGKDYTIAPELKQRKENILVLAQATVPAVLILCGNLDKKSDFDFITNDKNQDKIARDILEGARKYSLENSDFRETPPSSNTTSPEADTGGAFTKVEIEAGFPSGFPAWQKYLIQTLKYPPKAILNEVQGKVIVQFIVRTNGSLADIRAVSGPGVLRAESVRVIRESGKWIPAKDHGKIVSSYKKQPIIYRLEPGS